MIFPLQSVVDRHPKILAVMDRMGDAREYGHGVDYALYHLALGETDAAFEYLTLLAGQHHPFLMMVLIGGPYESAIRSSPKWPALAARIGLARANAAPRAV